MGANFGVIGLGWLGRARATTKIIDGAQVAIDAAAGFVRWIN